MWHLADHSAQLQTPTLVARLNALEPWLGCTGVEYRENRVSGSFLQCDLREHIAPNRLPLEVYVRGDDLVASYPPSEARNVQTHLYWRSVGFGSGSGIEVIVSAQTHLLDSRPALAVVSSVAASEVLSVCGDDASLAPLGFSSTGRIEFSVADPCNRFLLRPEGADFSYLEIVHPSDFAGSTLEQRGDTIRLVHRLFPDRLEKGVIRRGRVCGLFLPRANDVAAAIDAYRAMLDAPLPLTA